MSKHEHEPEKVEDVRCSSRGHQYKLVDIGTYRSLYIPPNGSKSEKADAIDDLLRKMSWDPGLRLCTAGCENPDTERCRATTLESKIDDHDDCELTIEEEEDGTTYYKAVVKRSRNSADKGYVSFKGRECECLPRVF